MKSAAIAILLCSLPALQSCEAPQPYSSLQLSPLLRISHSRESADSYYQLGRYYLQQGRDDKAASALLKATAFDPNHADAYNALGLIHAHQARYDEALAMFRHALALSPGQARFHNNIGYAQYLQGHYAEAAAAFEQALNLEPGNAHSRANLAQAQEKLGLPSREKLAYAPSPSAPPAPGAEPLAQGSGTLPAAPSPLAVAVPEPAWRLEIANGNGATGLARRTGQQLSARGFPAARLSNQQPYHRDDTRIEYRAGFEAQAKRLAGELSSAAPLSARATLRAGVDVRLLLGKDAAPAMLLAQR